MTIWEQLVEKKQDFIGGTLIEEADGFLGEETRTTITDLTFSVEQDASGEKYGVFGVEGKDWSMHANIRYLGMGASERGDGFKLAMTFMGGDTWHVLYPAKGGD